MPALSSISPARSTRRRQTIPELRELQRRAFGAITLPLAPSGKMQKTWLDGRAMRTVAAEFIAPNYRLSSLERLAIYNRQYWFRLLDCLWDDFPGLCAVLGKRRFEKLRIAYLIRHPSRTFSLRDLGMNLVRFLAEAPELTAPHEKLCLDMARFEWTQIVAFDGPAVPPIGLDALLGKEPSELRLALQPFITLLKMDYPLDEYLLALKDRDTAMRAESSNAVDGSTHAPRDVRPPRRPRRRTVYLAVHRHNNELYYKRLRGEEYAVLCAIRDGATLSEACESVLDLRPLDQTVIPAIGTWFRQWGEMGWLCGRVGRQAAHAI